VTFNSISFFAFFILIYALYRGLGHRFKLQNVLLLIASYAFYAVCDWRYLALLAGSTVVDYYLGGLIVNRPNQKKQYVVVSCVLNIGLLFAFKYFNFFQDNLLTLLHNLGLGVSPMTLQIVLPVGISFFTFQKMTYVIDLYRGKLSHRYTFIDFALFVSFFPLILSGPIERAINMLPQIAHQRTIQSDHISEGLWLITWGLFKKIYIADNLARIVDSIFAPAWAGTGTEALIGVYAYAVQIYCDFSGYTDMARGLAKLMGFQVMINFNLPYFAVNPSDFWRRWHISLSSWLRDYVYIPLGGSRIGTFRTYGNLLLVMLLVGLWHGAAWTFIVWGIYHGGLLIVTRLSIESLPKEGGTQSRLIHWLSVLLTFHLICFGWLIFRADSLSQVQALLTRIFTEFHLGGSAVSLFSTVFGYVAILLLVQTLQHARGSFDVLVRTPVFFKGIAYGALFYLMAMHGGVSDSFIYFQF
jgi:alginate O-acetyltransferase complex protein AlgI